MQANLIVNFVLFQVGWFACVLGGAWLHPVVGAGIALAIIGLHIWRAARPERELYLVLLAMLIGGVWDSVLVWRHWLEYPAGTLMANTAPYWIVVMWGLFATTLNVSLRWLKERLVLGALLGAFAGPLAYFGGARLGAVQFIDPGTVLVALGIGWAVFTPLLVTLSRRFDGYPAPAR